ncbi:threonine dehydrogenase-like Zn-dependent dehydrogenase [Paraburkholderia sp. WC7.3g]
MAARVKSYAVLSANSCRLLEDKHTADGMTNSSLEIPMFKKVAIFGVGLIGGSFALALKKAGGAGQIVGGWTLHHFC